MHQRALSSRRHKPPTTSICLHLPRIPRREAGGSPQHVEGGRGGSADHGTSRSVLLLLILTAFTQGPPTCHPFKGGKGGSSSRTDLPDHAAEGSTPPLGPTATYHSLWPLSEWGQVQGRPPPHPTTVASVPSPDNGAHPEPLTNRSSRKPRGPEGDRSRLLRQAPFLSPLSQPQRWTPIPAASREEPLPPRKRDRPHTAREPAPVAGVCLPRALVPQLGCTPLHRPTGSPQTGGSHLPWEFMSHAQSQALPRTRCPGTCIGSRSQVTKSDSHTALGHD